MVASPRDLSRAIRTIRAPICASRSAAISPIPEVPPVMTTVLPFIRILLISSGANQSRDRKTSGIQPFTQLRPAPPARDVLDGDRHRFLLPEQDDEPLAAGDPGVKQIALQHQIVLCRDGNDDSGKFRAL